MYNDLNENVETTKLHYIKPADNHIVIDFDLKDGSGKGVHHHYICKEEKDELNEKEKKQIEKYLKKDTRSTIRLLNRLNSSYTSGQKAFCIFCIIMIAVSALLLYLSIFISAKRTDAFVEKVENKIAMENYVETDIQNNPEPSNYAVLTPVETWESEQAIIETDPMDLYLESAAETEKEKEILIQEETTQEISENVSETTDSQEKITDIEETANTENNIIGRFHITGYSSREGTCGTTSASGLPLIAGKTCAMYRGDMADYGINYGDWITINTYSNSTGVHELGSLQVVDCCGGSGIIDVFCGDDLDYMYYITGYATVSY